MPTVRRLVPLLTLLAVLLAAPAARAAFTSEVDAGTKTVTITGDDASDFLTLGDTGAVLSHNIPAQAAGLASQTDFDTDAGVQSVDADETWTIVVKAGGGADQITVQTPEVETVDADLGAGDDAFQGAGSSSVPGTEDKITGGPGHDRVAGGRAADELAGGEGNDTLVWSNGDGNDELEGEAGIDTVEVNGAPAADDQIQVKVENGMARLDRVNLSPFHLLVKPTTERLQVNGLGGADTMTAADGLAATGVALEFNGGTGSDTLTGGDAGDTLIGGDDVDTLNGGPGDDRITGDRGNDTMAGGDGDDTMVWNNGDNNDKADGDGGFDVMEVNGAGAGDAFTIKANGTRTQLDRTNLVPFGIDLAAEVLDLDTLGGDDRVTASGAPAALLDVDGGAGNDMLAGDAGHDSLRGGSGADALTGGGGLDAIDGDEGDDTITAADGQPDAIRCGAGSDRALTDREGIDAAADCEFHDRPIPSSPPPPAQGPKAAAVRIATGKVTVKKLRARIRLECPAGATTCQGRLTLTTPRAVKVGRVRVIVVLGSASYRIAPGAKATVTVKLSKALRTIAGRAKSVRVSAVAGSDAGGGATLVTSRRVTLTKKRRW